MGYVAPESARQLRLEISKDKVVSLRVQMYDAHGNLLQSAGEPLEYLHGGYGGLPGALEEALEGRSVGETARVQLEPEQAFGEYDAQLVRLEPAERYGDGIAVGMEVEEDARIYTVTDVAGGKVVLDANHPLAGMALRFVCEIVAIRMARPEEIARGVSFPQA